MTTTSLSDSDRKAIIASLRAATADLLEALDGENVGITPDAAVVHGKDFIAFLEPKDGKLTITHYDRAAWAEQVNSAFDDFDLSR